MAESAAKRPKRKLRNAETVRERAIKAQEEATKPAKPRVASRVTSTAIKPARGLGRILRRTPLKWLGRPLRFIGRILLPAYFRNSWRELRLVTWPNRKQSRQLTFAVLLFAIIFGAVVSLVDYGLDKLFKQVLLK